MAAWAIQQNPVSKNEKKKLCKAKSTLAWNKPMITPMCSIKVILLFH
jgi:hypothetical protein